MKRFRKFLVSFLTLTVIFCTSSFMPVKQAVAASTKTSEISAIEAIAKNAPQYLLGSDKKEWSDVSVVNEKPLYDFEQKLIAYSVDLKSNINGEKAFAIISTSENDGPIYEFAKGRFSPYGTSTDTCIYDGVTGYYLHNTDGNYFDLTNKVKITDADVTTISKTKKYISAKPDNAKNARAYLKQTSTVRTNATLGSINSSRFLPIPDYYWYKGCAPTSAAMVLKYRFPSQLSAVASMNLIDKLAIAMRTDSAGQTFGGDIPIGMTSVMRDYGVNISCSINGQAPYQTAVSYINQNHPFVICVWGCTQTSPGYPDGFGNHAMACDGYITITPQAGVSGNFLSVHDTACDGDVLIDYDSSTIGYNTALYPVN